MGTNLTTEQTVSVTVLPGPMEVTIAGDYLLVTDTRGGSFGWTIQLAGATATSIHTTTEGSAPGLRLDGNSVVKDAQVGPGGSTGGQWLITLDREWDVTVRLWSNDIEETEWTVSSGEAVTKVFGAS